jgi:hypothetical protein
LEVRLRDRALEPTTDQPRWDAAPAHDLGDYELTMSLTFDISRPGTESPPTLGRYELSAGRMNGAW